MLGYEGYLKVNNTVCLVVNANSTMNRNRIDSSGVYGVTYKNAIATPHIYDHPQFDGNFSFEVSENIVGFVKGLIEDRARPFNFSLYTSKNGIQNVSNAYWTSITIGTSQDSLVLCTITFTATLRESFKLSDGYFSNDFGLLDGSEINSFNDTDPLNYNLYNLSPYPFWSTNIPELNSVSEWSITLSQDITRNFGCQGINSTTPASPYSLGIGLLNGQFDYVCQILKPDNDYDNGIIGSDNIDIINNLGFVYGSPTRNRKKFTIKLSETMSLFTLIGEVIDTVNPIDNNNGILTARRSYLIYEIEKA